MMRKNKLSVKRATEVSVLLLLVLSLSAYTSSFAKMKEIRLLRNLEQNIFTVQDVDKRLLNDVCDKIYVKQDKGDLIKSEEYYYLAYKNMIDKDKTAFKNNLLNAYSLINYKTDIFVKINLYGLISQGLDDEISLEEQTETFRTTLKSLTVDQMNDNVDIIKYYINVMGSKITDKKILIDALSKIVTQSYILDSKLCYYVRDSLAVENINQGDYAKAIELTLQSLWQNEKDPNPYYEARAYINTGLVYYELNDYDTAIEYMNKSMDVKIEDDELNTHAKLYGLINMYLIYYDKEDYDSMFNNFNLIKEYIDYDSAGVFKIYEQIAYAKYYLKINDIYKAEEHVKLANDLYSLYGEDNYNDSNLHLLINICELNYKKGNLSEAIKGYEELLMKSDTKYNSKKRILQNLANIYTDMEDCKNSVKYLKLLKEAYEDESVMINTNYSNNLVEIRKYENEMKDIRERRDKSKAAAGILLFITFMIFCHFYITNTKLKKINKTDGLTNIYNRKYFNEVYEKLLQEGRSFNVIIFDIDDFKVINDTYGHVFGDKILAGTVSSVEKILNKQDQIFRYGGEEFVIINYDNDKNEVADLCERIRKSVESIQWEIDIKVTISIGACSRKDCGNNVLEDADECLYKSKNTGKNKYTIM